MRPFLPACASMRLAGSGRLQGTAQGLQRLLPRHPADPRVIVADQPGGWAAAPSPKSPQGQLWSVLRLTLLYCIWTAYASKDPQLQTAAAVVKAAIRAIRFDIVNAYGRHMFDRHLINALRRAWPACDAHVPATTTSRTSGWRMDSASLSTSPRPDSPHGGASTSSSRRRRPCRRRSDSYPARCFLDFSP